MISADVAAVARTLERYSERIADKYVVYTKDLRKEKDIIMLPVYLLPFLKAE